MLKRQPSSDVKLSVYCPVTVGRNFPVQRTDKGDLGKKGSGAWLAGSKLIHSSLRTFGVPCNLVLSKYSAFNPSGKLTPCMSSIPSTADFQGAYTTFTPSPTLSLIPCNTEIGAITGEPL